MLLNIIKPTKASIKVINIKKLEIPHALKHIYKTRSFRVFYLFLHVL